MVSIAGFDGKEIRSAVRKMYSAVAQHPSQEYHFPTGRRACLFVGYPKGWLDALPAEAVESFAGVNFPFDGTVISRGAKVLDVGSGSGTDALTCARLVGSSGKVHALDMTPAMLAKLRATLAATHLANVNVIEADAEAIPLPAASIDVVTSNGVLNLVPNKARAFSEIFRVLRPGGSAQIADVVVSRVVSEQVRSNPQLWAECIVGAMTEAHLIDTLRTTGFTDIKLSRRLDYFSGSSSPETRKIASGLGAISLVVTMRRPSDV